LCDGEGNRRSGVALAMRHRLCDISTVRHQRSERDEHPAYHRANFSVKLKAWCASLKIVQHLKFGMKKHTKGSLSVRR